MSLPYFLFCHHTRKEIRIHEAPVLNDADLILICAALRFWRDEMLPHELGLAANYFAPGERGSLPKSVDVGQLLKRLERCRIRFVICDPDHELILHRQVFASMADAQQNCAEHVTIAIALVPD